MGGQWALERTTDMSQAQSGRLKFAAKVFIDGLPFRRKEGPSILVIEWFCCGAQGSDRCPIPLLMLDHR